MADLADLFPGFQSHWIDVEMGRIFARSGGSGPPLMLLHGFPQTHVCWHRVAPRLAEHFTVVAMDLRGYGWSTAPDSDPAHAAYSKRAMGEDVVAVMSALGHARFALMGHDRGARVGYRLALDDPGRLTALALLDIVPTMVQWQRIARDASVAPHWRFLAEPAPRPETEILKNPQRYFDGLLAAWSGSGDLSAFDPRALAHYRAASNEPNRIHAFCEDYRAGAGADREQDEADLDAGKTIACPSFLVCGESYLSGGAGPALTAWHRTFAPDMTGTAVEAGHFVAEEAPEAVLDAVIPFLSGAR
ncbi:alpha/beta fold hydrolase [Chelatococcus asaccharovorans]|nr:alpha/beta hydrolase [Chelatococcus asaccharovorans]MBS7702259.1 alpha/beta hydrolase [Chelatococcus asaccharovorans]